MFKWDIDQNVISKLYYRGKNIINPWGIETADSSTFFSLETGCGYRYQTIEENYKYNNNNYRANLVVQMKEGCWHLNIDDKIKDNSIIRKVEATTLVDSFFMDFVLRYRFKKEFIEYVQIADKIYYHKNTNIYYQYSVDKVFLKGKGFDINISIIDKIVPQKMKPVMYVRDNKDEWIVHVRMVPKLWDKEVIKICTAWAGTRSLPQFISKPLLSIKFIKDALWYRGEKKPYKCKLFRKFINPCAFGLVKVDKNSKLMWQVKIEII